MASLKELGLSGGQAGGERRPRGANQGDPPSTERLRLAALPRPFRQGTVTAWARAHQGMVTADLRSVFTQESAAKILISWGDVV